MDTFDNNNKNTSIVKEKKLKSQNAQKEVKTVWNLGKLAQIGLKVIKYAQIWATNNLKLAAKFQVW